MAALLERWQVLEMEHGDEKFICRLAALVITDPSFFSALKGAVREGKGWIRDMSGVLFRFWGLIQAHSLILPDEHRDVVLAAVEVIFQPLESTPPAPLAGHYYGALYMQALVPWLCAYNSGQQSAHLREIVRRVARAVVKGYKAQGSDRTMKKAITERMHIQYLQLSQEGIWGHRPEDDIMHSTFY
jgi:hypothetical protein